MSDGLGRLPQWRPDDWLEQEKERERLKGQFLPQQTPQYSPTEAPTMGRLPDWHGGLEDETARLERLMAPNTRLIRTILASSKNPDEDLDKAISASYLADRLQLPFEQVFANHDQAAEAYWGRTVPGKTALTAITDAWKAGSANVEVGKLAFRQMMGDTSPLLQEQIDEIEKGMPTPDQVRRILPIEAFKAAANLFPYMWENWKFSAPKALAAAGVATGIVAASGVEAALPAVFGAWFLRTMAISSSAFTFQVESGIQYRALIKAGVAPNVARAVSIPVGAVNAALEQVQLVNLPGVREILQGVRGAMAREVGREIVVKGALAKIAERFVARGASPLTQGIRRGVATMAAAQITEPITEVAQEAMNIVGDALGAAWNNASKNTTLPIATTKEIGTRLLETYRQTALAMLVMGAGGSLGTGAAQLRRGALSLDAQRIIADQVKPPETVTPAGEPGAREGRAAVAPPPAPAAPAEYRTPEGRYAASEGFEGELNGVAQYVLAIGNPETQARYGHIRYNETPDRILITDVVTEAPPDRARDLVLELAARNPGMPIEWMPADEAQAELVDELTRTNPRGPEFGLQWFAPEEEVAPPEELAPAAEAAVAPEEAPAPTALTQDIFKRRMMEAFTLTEPEATTFTVFNQVAAANLGMAENDFLNRFFDPRVADRGPIEREQALVDMTSLWGAPRLTAASAFTVAGQTIDVHDVDADEYKGLVRGLFSTFKSSDLHHALHEYFHVLERLALTPVQIRAMEGALGKLRSSWTDHDIEVLADHFEQYLGTARAPVSGLEAVFAELAAMLHRLVSWTREHLGRDALSPEFLNAYDTFFSNKESGAGMAAATAEPVVVRPPPAQAVQPELGEQPPEERPTERLAEIPVEGKVPEAWTLSAQRYADVEAKVMGEPSEPVSDRFREWHRGQILEAMREGKPVPAEVLREYPELAGEQKAPGQAGAAERAAGMRTDTVPTEGPPDASIRVTGEMIRGQEVRTPQERENLNASLSDRTAQIVPPAPPPMEPDQVAAAFERQERKPTDGSWEGSSIADQAQGLQRLAKRMKGWQTAEQLTARDRQGRKGPNQVRKTSDDIQKLRVLGFAQAAWDHDGMVWYAPMGEPLPPWLGQAATDDRSLEELPTRAEVEGAPEGPAEIPGLEINRGIEILSEGQGMGEGRRVWIRKLTDLGGGVYRLRAEFAGQVGIFWAVDVEQQDGRVYRAGQAPRAAVDTRTPVQRQVQQDTVEAAIAIEMPEEVRPPPELESVTAFDASQVGVVEIPVARLTLSEDVPNFKEGANKRGVVRPIEDAEYRRLPIQPIVVWERVNGALEVVTGRHRLDLAQRLGQETIPGQIVREADGFTAAMAMTLDAEANIRDEQGSVRDYATYFKNTSVSEETASRGGLLRGDKGRAGFTLGRYAEASLYSLWWNGKLGTEKAAAIAAAAPGLDSIQRAGIAKADEFSAPELEKYLVILQEQAARGPAAQQGVLFGDDESAQVIATALAREAARKEAELKLESNALKGALRLSGPQRLSIVAQYGFKPGDVDAIGARLAELEGEIVKWSGKGWMTGENIAELKRRAAGLEEGQTSLLHIEPAVARTLNYETQMPDDPLFKLAVENTEGAWVTDEGLFILLDRYQDPGTIGSVSPRTGIYYVPQGRGNKGAFTLKEPEGAPAGERVKYTGRTLIKRPMFLQKTRKGGALLEAYEVLQGKEAAAALEGAIIDGVVAAGWRPDRSTRALTVSRISSLLSNLGGNPEMARLLIASATGRDSLVQLIEAHLAAHAVRKAGFDSVIGYGIKGRAQELPELDRIRARQIGYRGAERRIAPGEKPYISSVFDVRELTYPGSATPTIHRTFTKGMRFYRDERDRAAITARAVDHFGITGDPGRVGFIAYDGSLLDLAGESGAVSYGWRSFFTEGNPLELLSPPGARAEYFRAYLREFMDRSGGVAFQAQSPELHVDEQAAAAVHDQEAAYYRNRIRATNDRMADLGVRAGQGKISTMGRPSDEQFAALAPLLEGLQLVLLDVQNGLGETVAAVQVENPTVDALKDVYDLASHHTPMTPLVGWRSKGLMFHTPGFHGTGAMFDKFDPAFATTGAGSEAFGWGTYISQDLSVARGYGELVAAQVWTVTMGDQEPLPLSTQRGLTPNIRQDIRQRNKALAVADVSDSLRQQLLELGRVKARNGSWGAQEGAQRAIDDMRTLLDRIMLTEPDTWKLDQRTRAVVYRVTINPNAPDVWLDWQKPVGPDQATLIEKALARRKLDWLNLNPAAQNRMTHYLGEVVYGLLEDRFGARGASEFLSAAGFTGSRMPARARRRIGVAGPPYNYVVFDPKEIRIEQTLLFHPAADEINEQWVLRSQQVLDQKVHTPMLASQLRGVLLNNQVRADEMKWIGLDEFLEEERKIRPEELRQWIGEHRVILREVVRGAGTVDQGQADRLERFRGEMNRAGREFGRLRDQALMALINVTFPEAPIGTSIDFTPKMAAITQIVDDLAGEGSFRVQALEKATALVPGFDWMPYIDAVEMAESMKERYQALLGKIRIQPTRYGGKTMQLPGGADYRELTISIPGETEVQTGERWQRDFERKAGADPAFAEEYAAIKRDTPPAGAPPEAEDRWLERMAAFQERVMKGVMEYELTPDYASHAFPEPNIVLWTRFNERTDDRGRRVLFMEELQSDWHQGGHKLGYKEPQQAIPVTRAERRELVGIMLKALQERGADLFSESEIEDLKRQLAHWEQGIGDRISRRFPSWLVRAPFEPLLVPMEGRGADLIARVREYERVRYRVDQDERPPAGPFSATWHELAFKRMVRWAAAGNFEVFAWTTGDTQIKRWSLRQVADQIEYDPKTQWLKVYKDEDLIMQEAVEPDKLGPIIGRELASRLLASPLGKDKDNHDVHFLDGERLEFGGEGKKALYDTMLGAYARKFAKKFDAKVDDIQVETMPTARVPTAVLPDPDNPGWFLLGIEGTEMTWGAHATREEAEEMLAKLQAKRVQRPVTVHSIEITPAMRASAMQGLLMFHPDGSDQAADLFGKNPEDWFVDQARAWSSPKEFREAVEAVSVPLPGEQDRPEEEVAAFYERIWNRAHPFVPLTPERATKDFLKLLQAQGNRQFWGWIEATRTQGTIGSLPPAMQRLVGRLSSGKKPADAEQMSAPAVQAALKQIRRQGRLFRGIYAAAMNDSEMQRQLRSEQGPGVEPAPLPGIPLPPGAEPEESNAEIRRAVAELVADPEFSAKIRSGEITESDLVKREAANTENLSQLRKNEAEAITDKAVAQVTKQLKAAEKERLALMRIRRSKKAMAQRITREPPGTIDFEYAQMIRTIAETVDPHFRAEKTLFNREQSRRFFEANPEALAALDPETWKSLQKRALNEMSVTELEDLVARVKELEQLGRFKRGLKMRQERRLRRNESARVQATVLRGREPAEAVGAAKPMSWLARGILSTIKPDRVMLLLDNARSGGPFTALLDAYNTGWNAMQRIARGRRERVLKVMETLKMTTDQLSAKRLAGYSWLNAPVDIDGFRFHQGTWKGQQPTVQDVMYWYLGHKNARTWAALTGGNNIPEDVIMAGIAKLTDPQKELADAIGKEMNDNFQRLREAFIERFNIDLPAEDWYVPMRRMEVNYKERSTEIVADLIARNGLGKAFVERHPTHERIDVPDYWQTPIKTKLVDVWLQSIEESEGFIHLDLPVKRMHAILEDPLTRQAITQVHGSAMNRWLFVFTNDLARPDIYKSLTGVDRLQRALRQNVVIAYLGLNLLSAAKNLVTVLPYLADAGPAHLVSAAGQWLAGKAAATARGELFSNDLVKWVKARSELVANRSIAAELELLKQTHGNLWRDVQSKVGEAGMKLFEAIDMASIVIGWKAVYDRVYKETKNEAEAAAAADRSTIRGQPSGRVQDMAEMYRGSDVLRWFTMFTSALNSLWNIAAVDLYVAAKNGRLLHAAGDVTALVLSGLGIAIATGALSDPDPEERKKRLAAGAWTQFVDMLPYVGSEISAFIQGRPTGQGVKLFPSIQGLRLGVAALTEGDLEAAAKGLGEALMFGVGFPVTGPKRILKALETGEVIDLMGWK